MTESGAPLPDPFDAVLAELRSPIVAIQDHVRTLMARDDALVPAARQQLLQQTLRHSQRLDTLVDDIVLYLRLLTRSVSLHPRPVRIHDLVEEIRERLGEPERVTNAVPRDYVLIVDEVSLSAAVRRLVRNALVYGARERSITVSVASVSGAVELQVADEGFGIPAGGLSRAFEPFVRGVHPAERRGDGAGLGLTVCRELARLLGGEVELRPRNPGLTAVITLPREG